MDGRTVPALPVKMNRLIESLRSEHADLRLAIALLEAIATEVEAGGAFPADDCALVLRYLREFVVGVHFAKESQSLLHGLLVYGDDRDLDLAGGLLRTQEDVRVLLHSLAVYWEPLGDLTAAEQRGFAAAARSVAALLRRGMRLEESRLFAAACRRVPADDRMDWPQICADVGSDRRPSREWRRDLEALRGRWLS